MASIGQQIIAARKAKDMTQDALSKALNISRSAVAHWETERTIPDAEMLLKLSKVLDYSFEDEGAKVTEPAPEDDGSPAEEGAKAPQTESGVLSGGRVVKAARRRRILICAAVAAALCVCLAALLIHNNRSKPVEYRDKNGTVYTIEQFQQETPREDGKAWLSTEQTLRVQKSEGNEMWMYDFIFHERNGIGFKIDRLEVYTFLDNDVHPQIISGELLDEYGCGSYIPANGDWSIDGGMPVQKKVASIGVILSGTDDNGEKLTFPGYLNLIGLD